MSARIVGLAVAWLLALACAGGGATAHAATQAPASAAEPAASALRFAWLRDGGARLWRVDAAADSTEPAAPGPGEPLPATLDTQLGSVWKLFVYAYLVDRRIAAPDYQCEGGDRDEVYCCMTGGHIDRERALVQSCGLFFEPHRLQLDPAGWRQYWRAHQAPAWLLDLYALKPEKRVRVADLLAALQAIPARARDDTGDTLVSVVTSGRGEGTVARYGSLLRAKTWTMPDGSGGYLGGAAGWLADGTPVWLGGRGGSVRVLAAAAPRLAPLVAQSAVPDDRACVAVELFSRYPVRAVFEARPGGRAVPPGLLVGAYRVAFGNGNALPIESHGDLRLDRDDTGKLHIAGRFGMNDYVARVVEREGDTAEPQAARALAVAARSYLVQNAGRERGCYAIDDSSRTQRVLPRPPQAASRNAADFTDGLVLAGAPVQFHHDRAGPGRMSWLDAKAAAARGLGFDAILARTWPQATLTSFASPLAGDCEPVLGARDWLAREAPLWARRLAGEPGYETPELPAVCEVSAGRPYADAGRNRVYIRRLRSDDDRIALTHEYLHLAFAHHPRGLDERFVEQTARRLILTGN